MNENESDKSKELMNQYKDFNFTDSALIISNKVTVESASQQLSLQEVYLKDKVIYHFIKTNNPSIYTDDQQERYFIYKIDKDILNNIDYKLEMCY